MNTIKLNKIKQELKNTKNLEDCAYCFSIVGNETRMKICWLLCRYPELSVSEIAIILGQSVSTVSHSLKKLRDFSLVETRRVKKNVFYKLSDCSFNEHLKNILKTL